MAHTAGLRATSLGVSALALGALVFAALTATTRIDFDFGSDAPVFDIFNEPAPPPKPEPEIVREPQTQTIRDAPAEGPVERIAEIEDFAELAPIETSRFVGGGGPVTISTPHWTQRPGNLARYYPQRAISREVEGVVILDCLVRVSGSLDCTPISETPAGWGFAEAALRISRDYAMTPAMRGGEPVEGRYRMRVPFDLR